MSFAKSALVAVLVAATGLGATMTTAAAGSKKHKYYGHHHHHHHHRHSKARNFAYGAIVGAAVVGAMSYESCKKWKHRYNRTGNPAFLDRYYACRY
ncbi:hypothetical protein [Hyphomicrobium sp.]|uniref:hypothetical protein n=1 Tax=Hyphomicrobium sp. TaxID=82 RepID=UPI002FDD7DF9